MQAEHLIERGHRQLAFAHLSDARADRYGQERHDGVVQACRELDLPTPETLTVPIDIGAAVEQLQDLQATALACYNDDVAITLSAAARRLGPSRCPMTWH